MNIERTTYPCSVHTYVCLYVDVHHTTTHLHVYLMLNTDHRNRVLMCISIFVGVLRSYLPM